MGARVYASLAELLDEIETRFQVAISEKDRRGIARTRFDSERDLVAAIVAATILVDQEARLKKVVHAFPKANRMLLQREESGEVIPICEVILPADFHPFNSMHVLGKYVAEEGTASEEMRMIQRASREIDRQIAARNFEEASNISEGLDRLRIYGIDELGRRYETFNYASKGDRIFFSSFLSNRSLEAV